MKNEFQMRIVLAGLADHFRRGIQADDFRTGFSNLLREAAGTATEIEDSLTRLGFQEFKNARSVLPNESVAGFVEFRIPARFQDV